MHSHTHLSTYARFSASGFRFGRFDSSRVRAVEISQVQAPEEGTYPRYLTPSTSVPSPGWALSAGTADGRLAEPPAITSATGNGCSSRALGPHSRRYLLFPRDGRDLGPYRLPCTEVPTPLQSSRQSSIVTPQILICRATQSLARIIRHDDLCLAAHLLLPSPPQSLLRVVYGHVQMSLPPVWYLLYVG